MAADDYTKKGRLTARAIRRRIRDLEREEVELLAKADRAYHVEDVIEYGNAAADARDEAARLARLLP